MAAQAEAPVATLRGGAGDDLLVGTSGNDHILGGEGDDTLSGGGGHDTLEGGAGDDRIELGEGVVAVGGAGADTFVVEAPIKPGHPETLLGVILDFAEGQGDKVITWRGDLVHVPPHPPTGGEHFVTFSVSRTAGPMTPAQEPGPGEHPLLTAQTFTRVDVDLDGDGQADGYLLVAHHGGEGEGDHPEPPAPATHPAPHDDDHAIAVTGHALLGGGGDFGG
ncbi:MAG: calcium-binding protein [Caulobacterales bacterium]|nr:calcium-binding protein [Caulobacterales bacterium]